MEGLIMTGQLLLSLSILIAVHEWGHFIAARMFNIRVEKFYLFFDFLFPMANVANFALFKYKKGETEYGIGWFPLGGYVKIAGMVDESMDKDQMKEPPKPDEFRSKPAWQRLIVMLGGIIVNIVVGIFVFICVMYFIGDYYLPIKLVNDNGGIEALAIAQKIGLQTGDKIVKVNGQEFEYFESLTKPDVLISGGSYYTVERGEKIIDIPLPEDFIENFDRRKAAESFMRYRVSTVVEEVNPEVVIKDSEGKEIKTASVASSIGLMKGDKIINVNDTPVAYRDELSAVLAQAPDSVRVAVARGTDTVLLKGLFKGHSILGFMPRAIKREDFVHIEYSLGQSIVQGPGRGIEVLVLQAKSIWKLVTGKISVRTISSPIGIAQAYGGTWDWERFWRMTGLISLALAFMNLLPIPGLDGGYVVFLLYEMITGREPSEKVFENSIKVGMALLLLLMVFAFSNDIVKLFSN